MTERTALDDLISREIEAASAEGLKTASLMRVRAHDLQKDAETFELTALRTRECDRNGTHEFEEVKGSGRMGSRFEEKCKNCDWVHTS